MAEAVLYGQLTKYNEKIENHYKDNWGSVLTFLRGRDTDALIKKAEAVGRIMGAGAAGQGSKANDNSTRSLLRGGSRKLVAPGRSQEPAGARKLARKGGVVISRHAVSSERYSDGIGSQYRMDSRATPLAAAMGRTHLPGRDGVGQR